MGVAIGISTATVDLPKTRAALDYAAAVHAGQRRESDGAPFIAHPREVAALLYRTGAPDHLIAAGALHDVIEKTPATVFDLRRRFGSEIATLVLAVSERGHGSSYAQNKAILREQAADAGEEALMIFAADKISKTRELQRRPPLIAMRARRDRRRRLAHYRRSYELLRERLPKSGLVEELREALAAVP
jgi:guanosine-3',5'-bis(diphosphate) 3'-pyrophosphohydrolase